jgi:DNA-binding NarL/FixJ family response regulator
MLLLVEGCSNREIAARLGIDDSTVKAHIGRLMRKAGVTNRTALTVHALSRQSIGGTPY